MDGDSEALKGFVVLVGLCAFYGFILMSCMERRIGAVGRIIYETEEKYVN
jgi:hypothetical protein